MLNKLVNQLALPKKLRSDEMAPKGMIAGATYQFTIAIKTWKYDGKYGYMFIMTGYKII
jgi:hypothetical protein